MAFTPIEIIALLFIILGLIKLIVISINKKSWLPVPLKIYSNRKTSSIIFVILAAIIFYFLIQELSIVQIVAVMAFSSLLIGLAFLTKSKEFLSLTKKAYNSKLSPAVIVYTLFWLALMLWALYEIFF